jgi:hypothetical protein
LPRDWPAVDEQRMTMRRGASTPADKPRQPDDSPAPLSAPTKLVLSGLILFHLTAVFWGPFAFAANSGTASSPFAGPIALAMRPYMQALFLDHGYFFFAPNPGPSFLVRYEVEFDDGREPVTGVFPDLKTQQPRLLYHRHFMMATALSDRFAPPEPPPEPAPAPLTATAAEKAAAQRRRAEHARALAAWQHERRQYESLRNAFEQHLLAKHGGSKVTLTRVEHRQPEPDEFRLDRIPLNDPALYADLPEVIRPEERP